MAGFWTERLTYFLCLLKINQWQSECPPLCTGQSGKWSCCLFPRHGFRSEGTQSGQVSITESDSVWVSGKVRNPVTPREPLETWCSPLGAAFLSQCLFHQCVFSDAHHCQSSSYSAISLKCHLFPRPQIPSTSSFNLHPPALPAYRFSIFPFLPLLSPVLQLSPSSQTLPAVQPVWVFSIPPFFSPLPLSLSYSI